MAYALVSAGTAVTGTTSVSPSFGQATAANNLLVALVVYAPNGNVTPPAGWTIAGSIGGIADVFWKIASGGDSAPSFADATQTFMAAVLGEFSGNNTSSPPDVGTGENWGGNSIASPLSIGTGDLPDAAAGELVVAASWHQLSKAGTATTSDTFTNGAAAINLGNNDGTSSVNHYRFSYGITNSNAVATSDSVANNSMNLTNIRGAISVFLLAPVQIVPPSLVATIVVPAARIRASSW